MDVFALELLENFDISEGDFPSENIVLSILNRRHWFSHHKVQIKNKIVQETILRKHYYVALLLINFGRWIEIRVYDGIDGRLFCQDIVRIAILLFSFFN